MELPEVIMPKTKILREISPPQDEINSISNFNDIVNKKDENGYKILSYNIICGFYSDDFPELDLEKPLDPPIDAIYLYFYFVGDKKIRPVRTVFVSKKESATSGEILEYISSIYEIKLTEENVAFYKLYDSDYNYLNVGNKFGDIFNDLYFQKLEPYLDGFLVNIFD